MTTCVASQPTWIQYGVVTRGVSGRMISVASSWTVSHLKYGGKAWACSLVEKPHGLGLVPRCEGLVQKKDTSIPSFANKVPSACAFLGCAGCIDLLNLDGKGLLLRLLM